MASLPENMALDDSKMKEFKETVKSYKKKAKVKTAEREDKWCYLQDMGKMRTADR